MYLIIKTKVIKLIRARRRSRIENRYHPDMGLLRTRVTRIEKSFIGIPVEKIHEYRETYDGKIKSLKDCVLSRVNRSKRKKIK